MRSLLVLLLFAASHAQASVKSVFTEKGIGQIQYRVDKIGEPVYQPYTVTVSVLCEDHRDTRNLISPTWEKVLGPVPVCATYAPKFKGKTLTIYYRTSTPKPGQAECDAGWSQTFDLEELCAAWRR